MYNRQSGEWNKMMNVLKKWDGHDLLISKLENEDHDQTVLRLEEVEMKECGETIDGYVPDVALLLKGQGRVILENIEEPMPSNSYEIPLDSLYDIHYDEIRLYLATKRGSYTISPI